MLYKLNQTPLPATPRKNILPAALGALILVIVVGVVLTKSSTALTSLPALSAPVATTGWRIDVDADSSRTNQRFDGKFAPGAILYVPAGAPFSVAAEPPGADGQFIEDSRAGTWDHEGGELNAPQTTNGTTRQQCRAPMQPGLYHLVWQQPSVNSPLRLTLPVLVLTRAEVETKGEKINVEVNGKPIGAYLDPAKSTSKRVRENAAQYKVPQYFALLTPETIPLRLGEHFELGQLIAFKDFRDKDGKKVFTTQRHTDALAVRPELIDKLVKLRERLRAKGVRVSKFWITSGFRTPEYNRQIKGAAYSRHCYGDAVDLCIDEDNDKHMDDLNGDGRIDRKDGILIGNACRELEAEGAVVPGGIGVYEWSGEDSVRSHVHIDCRGYVSRWGQVDSGKYRKSFVWWPKNEFEDDDGGD